MVHRTAFGRTLSEANGYTVPVLVYSGYGLPLYVFVVFGVVVACLCIGCCFLFVVFVGGFSGFRLDYWDQILASLLKSQRNQS